MQATLSQLFIPLGVILAACIAAVLSLMALVISKEQKTSEFRQNWVDSLRSELAEFGSHARRIASNPTPLNPAVLLGRNAFETIKADYEASLQPKPLEENWQRLAQMYYAIKLRLNTGEKDHKILVTHMDSIYEILNENQVDFDATTGKLDQLSEVASSILKYEWTRVKVGESAFQNSIKIAKWGLGIFTSIFLIGFLYIFLRNF